MSNSEILHIKDDNNEELNNSEVLKRPSLKFQTECHHSISRSPDSHSQGPENEDFKEEEEEEEEEHLQGKISTTSSRVKNKVEDEEGFRTPTSLDHRIPVIKQCPPAPRKPKPSLKRFTHPDPLDLSKEVVELLLPTQHKTLFNSHDESTKKVRRE